MTPTVSDILLEGRGWLVCMVSVIAVFLAVGLAKRPNRLCRRCQTLNRPPARYCAQCGAKLNRG